ncbi:hypothetical protein CAEBREN_22556 [Caenorhabditis brenneri]|uniref:Uncharacterized protein n=1 Tax=Caenorhabditis brenneri TaxID=135651 RepID=G0PJI0_CAEBE|nr:hypothetical protein CAEBREN_22556 [Caenorhabditis brenneri]
MVLRLSNVGEIEAVELLPRFFEMYNNIVKKDCEIKPELHFKFEIFIRLPCLIRHFFKRSLIPSPPIFGESQDCGFSDFTSC